MPVILFPTTSRTFEGTVQDVLDRARYLLQDEGRDSPSDPVDTSLYRWSDPELILWVNDALTAAARLNGKLFQKLASHACTAGYYQTLATARAVQIVDVIGVPVADPVALTQYAPGWQASTPGPALNWMAAPGDPTSFMLYPPSPSDQSLTVMIVQSHLRVDDPADVIELPEVYIPALADYVVAMAEAKDDEAINTQRQQAFMSNFAALITGEPTK